MSRLSEERKLIFARELYAAPLHICIDTIWAEAYKAGQERMRERAATLTDQIGFDWSVADISQKDAAATYVARCLRNLEIEEPK